MYISTNSCNNQMTTIKVSSKYFFNNPTARWTHNTTDTSPYLVMNFSDDEVEPANKVYDSKSSFWKTRTYLHNFWSLPNIDGYIQHSSLGRQTPSNQEVYERQLKAVVEEAIEKLNDEWQEKFETLCKSKLAEFLIKEEAAE